MGYISGPSRRLDSWKDIAAYLKRDVSTVQRWERREALPVHRHRHEKLGSVYAFRSELDDWLHGRGLHAEQKTRRGEDSSFLSQLHTRVGRAGGTHRWLVAGALTAVVVGSIAYGLLQVYVNNPPEREIKSLAVLPLENLSADPAQDYFVDGMTEELIGSLAQIRALRVVSRMSAMSFKGSSESVTQIARDLNVDAVLEGSVQRAGRRVRIRLQLLHAPSDTYLWARDYEGELSDVLNLQTQVARAVAEEIRVQISPEERARMASVAAVNPVAHDEYLQGRYLLWKFIEQDRLRAISHFIRATQIDPSYAAPYAGLAHAWWMRGVFGPLSLKEVAPSAMAAARKALELDDGLAEAYAAQAYVQGIFDWDWAGAEETIRRAIDLDPNSMEAHYVYALLLMALGRFPEAITQIDDAAELDPLSAQVHSTFGRILYRARKFDEAILRLNRAIELEPRNAGAYVRLGDVYDQMGKHVEALAFYESGRALLRNPASRLRSRFARTYARMGRVNEARQVLKTLEDTSTQVGNSSANVYVALGDPDTAFRLLFRAVEERSEWQIYIKTDPPFDSLHADSRWNELLHLMNLPAD